jgi:hypothetical protein
MSNLADVKNKTVKITLNDGVERTIKFTLNALAELEDKFGSVQAAFDKLEKENSMKALRAILWQVSYMRALILQSKKLVI